MNENARNSGMSVVNSKNANQNIQNRVKNIYILVILNYNKQEIHIHILVIEFFII